MRALIMTSLVTSALLGACSSDRSDVYEGARGGLSDFGSSVQGGLGRNTDTLGTNRRVDVYGGSTAPSLPSFGAPGLGK